MIKIPREHVTLILASTFLAAFSLAAIVRFTDPNTAGTSTLLFFYISLSIVMLGIFTILGLLLRQWQGRHMYLANLSTSFRQGLLISFLVCSSLILQAKGLLFWWVEGTLILFIIFLEIFLNLKV